MVGAALSGIGRFGARQGRSASNEAYSLLSGHSEVHDYTAEQLANFAEVEAVLGVRRGEPMSFAQADSGTANLQRDLSNCAAVVVAHEMRLRGFNVTAKPADESEGSASSRLSANTLLVWRTAKGVMPQFTTRLDPTASDFRKKLDRATCGVGARFHVSWDLKQGGGHILTAERTAQGLFFYDPQDNSFSSLADIVKDVLPGQKIEVLRVDKLLVDARFLPGILAAV